MMSKKKIPVQEKLKLKKKSYKASHEKEICQQIAKKKQNKTKTQCINRDIRQSKM